MHIVRDSFSMNIERLHTTLLSVQQAGLASHALPLTPRTVTAEQVSPTSALRPSIGIPSPPNDAIAAGEVT